MLLACAAPAWAIPSPDLIVNALASAAQAAGLLAAMSGAAVWRLRRAQSRGGVLARRGAAVLAAVAVLAVVGNLWQYVSHADERTRRLEANLWRKVADWERNFDAPQISAGALAERLARGDPLRLIDVREPEEFEVAHLAGAVHRRYADLLLGAQSVPTEGPPVVFLCDSGKRSGEVCEQLRRRGLPCQVLEGGYPQWVREGRPLAPAQGSWRTRFVPLPRYARDTVYLDTPEVQDLVRGEGARFVDVRSPEDFARDHLPGALNLPMRGMASTALQDALSALPRALPFVVACYDNRSCFHARVLGLKLTRLGLDFRGRYTVPHEFDAADASAERSLWARARRASSTAVDMAVEPLARALAWAAGHLGGLVPAMVLLLLATRLPLTPFAAKAQRDRGAARALAAASASLRERYGDDHFRWQRAVARQRRELGLTPWRNLGFSLLQLGLFVVCFAAVRAAANWRAEAFLWLPELSEPDPWYLLPLLLALAAGAATAAALRGPWLPRAWRWGLALAAAAGVALFGWQLAAALQLYLLGALVLMALQQAPSAWRGVIAAWRQGGRSTVALALEDGIDAGAVGRKAQRLGAMRAAGLAVPAGWVLPAPALKQALGDGATPERLQTLLAGLPLQAGALYAVRSSGLAEDGEARSFAGVFHSELRVGAGGLAAAVQRVWQSYASACRAAYAPGSEAGGGVIVQQMVDAQLAGVLFTRDPAPGGAVRVEWVRGLGDALASGHATPASLRFGRVSGQALPGEAAPPVDFAPLLALARRIEAMFGTAQDIEWAFDGRQFHVLQARDIVAADVTPDATADDADAHVDAAPDEARLIEQERHRLLDLLARAGSPPAAAALQQTDLSAGLPCPTPLSLSLLQRVRGDGGSTDRAFEQLGLDYRVPEAGLSEVQSAFGRCFQLVSQEQSQKMGIWASFSLSRSADEIEARWRTEFLPAHTEALRWREVMALDRLDTAELVAALDAWTRQFVEHSYVQADVINIAAEFYARFGAQALASASAGQPAHPQVPTLATHAHRAVHDWELSEPRFGEDPARFEQHFNAAMAAPAAAPAGPATSRLQGTSVQRALRFMRLKEEAKHACLRELAQLRRLLLEIDRRLALDGGVFQLRLEEIPGLLGDEAATLRRRIRERQAQARAFSRVVLGASLSLRELEQRLDWRQAVAGPPPEPAAGLRGRRVAGRREVTAPVRVLRGADDLALLRPGEIAVVSLADPLWLAGFDRAAGLVSEVGGWLAHLAILAREHDLPAVFGVADATRQLQTGDEVTLALDGRVLRTAPASPGGG